MADAAAISVRKPAAVEKLRGETGWVEAAERCLGVRRVRETECADPTVAPGLLHQPAEGVVPVLGLAPVFYETARRPVPAAAILIDDGIAMLCKVNSDLGARARHRHSGGALRAARRRFVIWGALEQDRKRAAAGRPIDVHRPPDAVPRDHPEVVLDQDLQVIGRIHPSDLLVLAGFSRKNSCIDY